MARPGGVRCTLTHSASTPARAAARGQSCAIGSRGKRGVTIDLLPAICIEVLSTERVYDRITKRMVYGAAGVQEYWVVEPADVIERWSGAALSRAEELSERLVTELLPGFALDLAALFARD